jgi:hypothetical protein
VSLASQPYCRMSLSTSYRSRRPHGSQTTERTGTRTSDRISAPSRGMMGVECRGTKQEHKEGAPNVNQVCDVQDGRRQRAILINPAHVCAAHQSGSGQVTLVMDYGEGGGYQNVEGDLKSVWETLTRTPVDLTWT